jgi:hypothetical protein
MKESVKRSTKMFKETSRLNKLKLRTIRSKLKLKWMTLKLRLKLIMLKRTLFQALKFPRLSLEVESSLKSIVKFLQLLTKFQ